MAGRAPPSVPPQRKALHCCVLFPPWVRGVLPQRQSLKPHPCGAGLPHVLSTLSEAEPVAPARKPSSHCTTTSPPLDRASAALRASLRRCYVARTENHTRHARPQANASTTPATSVPPGDPTFRARTTPTSRPTYIEWQAHRKSSCNRQRSQQSDPATLRVPA